MSIFWSYSVMAISAAVFFCVLMFKLLPKLFKPNLSVERQQLLEKMNILNSKTDVLVLQLRLYLETRSSVISTNNQKAMGYLEVLEEMRESVLSKQGFNFAASGCAEAEILQLTKNVSVFIDMTENIYADLAKLKLESVACLN